MKVKTKIIVYIIPVTLVFVILINISFGLFFLSYVEKQEQSQVDLITKNVESYISGQKTKCIGNVNDWAHWDATYDFITTGSDEYVTENLTRSTFENLDLNFMMFINDESSMQYERYFSLSDGEFSEFPSGFKDQLKDVLGVAISNSDTFGLFLLGNSYYFIASSEVTNSLITEPKNGVLIFGRQIDENVIAGLEGNTGCSIGSIRPASASDTKLLENDGVSVQIMRLRYSRDLLNIDLLLPNTYGPSYPAIVSLTMSRELFVTQMKSLYTFSAVSMAICILLSIFIFILLGRIISKPFGDLVRDVKQINVTDFKTGGIQVAGSSEFKFLRMTINSLLARIEAEQHELIRKSEELNTTLESVGDGVIAVDNEHKIQFINPVAQNLTGWTKDEALNQPIEQVFHIVSEYTKEAVTSPVDTVFKTDEIVELSNHTMLISKDGTERPIEDTASPIKDYSGITKGCVLVFRDFSERKEKQRYIEYLSYHDQLTGLYNRRFLEEELKKLDHGQNLPLSFIYADLNGLKIINDAFGHENGDIVIQWVADVFTSTCRQDDTIARTGGDEFLILLPKTEDTEVADLVEELYEKVAKLTYMNIEVSVSFGWDTKTDEQQSVYDVMRNAEDFMYQKKILSNTSKRNGIIKSILHTLHVKCPREEAHSRRVSSICEKIAKAYGLNADGIKELKTAGELHDIGKIAIDISILDKTGKLSESEWSQIKHHPEIGYRLLGSTNEFNNMAEYILAHHERWDGKGYPKGLKGASINWKARVIAIADSYDAMTCERPYHKALSKQEAAAEIRKCAGEQFDPEIARVFIVNVLNLEW